MKKKQKQVILQKANEKTINTKTMHLIMIASLVIIVTAIFFKIALLGYAPPASDTIQWRASAEQIIEYNKDH